MARMSKITRIIYLTDEIIGSRQPTGRINRIIKVVANRNVNRVTVFGRAVIVRGNINQDLVNINAADLLVSVAGMLWKNCENSGFFEFFYMAGQGTVGNPRRVWISRMRMSEPRALKTGTACSRLLIYNITDFPFC